MSIFNTLRKAVLGGFVFRNYKKRVIIIIIILMAIFYTIPILIFYEQ